MKKLFCVTVFAAGISVLAFAQPRIGVKAGYTNSTWAGTALDKEDKKSNNGFHLGLVGEWGLGNQFFFQPHLMLVRKGVRISHAGHMDHINVTSIDLPGNFIWKSSGKRARFFAGTGPQIGLNIAAKEIAKEENEEEDLQIGNTSSDDIKPLDFGWNFLTGVELNQHFFISANYSLGLANLNPIASGTAKSNYFSLSIGYFLGGQSKK